MKTTDFQFVTQRVSQLTDDAYQNWLKLHQNNEVYRSPFFHPEFTRLMSEVVPHAEVTTIYYHGREIGYFPFVRSRSNVAQPIGLNFSDYQGMILEPGFSVDPMALIKASRLAAWDFDHLHGLDEKSTSFALTSAPSHYLDLSEGYDAYVASRCAAGTRIFAQIGQKTRKLERTIGPIQLVEKTIDRGDLVWLAEMKSWQLKQMNVFNYFKNSWTKSFLETLARRGVDGFEGRVSKLLVNGQIIAMHLGIQSGRTTHALIPAYNPAFSKYSPGITLFSLLAKSSADQGIQRFELGLGRESFKYSLASHYQPLYSGTVDRRVVSRFLKQSWTYGKEAIRQTSFGPSAQRFVRRVRSLRTPTYLPNVESP